MPSIEVQAARGISREQTLLLGATWNFQARMIYEEASTSPLVDSRRIREAYILILVTSTRTRTNKGVTKLYDDPNDVFRVVSILVCKLSL